jgi:glycine cleavage system regulatory protein
MALGKQTIRIPSHVMARQVGEELVILNLHSEQYFGLDEVGTSMWLAMETHATLHDALESLASDYDVESDQLKQDLDELLSKLTAEGLIEVHAS